ncbi:DUF4386 domain-containing protein [Pseudoxanthomonas helianthi]|uniref:DUF4386 domain-containing protein n=1 Tax=Pseudoxanthomonas helianthi TaxID=1453541 RepID=A0A940X4Z4_9GAMM|nr:DUF4386 domain-containing protein [Pseudoxanthomonas helianthi]MBP3985242.1 DUF4386 domain-containing protein [Pseudoxanthomonas helianthi]
MNGNATLGLRRDGRVAGALYLVVVLTGMFCLAYVPSQSGGMIAEAAAHAGLFRAGIAAFLAMQVAFLLLPFALYRVFADVNRGAATLMVALAAVSVPIGLVAVTHRMEALSLLETAGANAADSANAAFALCLQRYGHGLRIASLFWGLWLLPFGWLVLRSGRIPRVLGLLLVLGGAGYVAQVFGGLVPRVADSALMGYVRMPAALGEIGSCLWLLAFGARVGRGGAPQSSLS